MHDRMKAYILPAFLAASLSACAGPLETRVSSSGATALAPATYIWAPDSGVASNDVAEAKRLVSAKLAERGFTAADTGSLHMEVAVASRPASLGLVAGEKDVLSPVRRKKTFQRCGDNEYRLGITITQIADGAEVYRGNASEYHCKEALGSVLPRLVDAALADLGQPRGTYSIKR